MHKLIQIDEATRTAVCVMCGPVKIRSGGKRQGWRCIVKARELRNKQRQYHPYKWIKTNKSLEELTCTECGFIPKDKSQIDIHHKDRNRKNNSLDNLIILCANCHRLEHCL